MQRPKIKIALTKIDWALECISILGMIFTFLLIFSNYSDLPDTLPKHYNFSGKPDAYGSRPFIWFLPTLTLILYFGLTILARFPHHFNYLFAITENNAERQYRNSVQLVRIIKTIIVLIFSYITFAKIQISLGKMDGLGNLFLPFSILLILGATVIFTYRSFTLK